MNEFQERIDLLSNAELLKVIRSKDDYQEKFWLLAIENAKKRGLSNEIKDIIAEIQKIKIDKEQERLEKLKKEASLVELYSERAIISFSVLFTSIAGSILFANNLKKLNREGSDTVLIFGFSYTIGLIILIYALPFQTLNSMGYLLNILGGFIINIHYGSKYYPENLEYKNKKTWKALLVALLIVSFFGFLYFMTKKI
jgi:hypothetical protein